MFMAWQYPIFGFLKAQAAKTLRKADIPSPDLKWLLEDAPAEAPGVDTSCSEFETLFC